MGGAEDVTSATFLAAWRTRAEAGPVGDSALPSLCAMVGDVVRTTARTAPVSVVDGQAEVVATAALDRCWSAVRRQGVADRFPDRSRWRAVLTVGDSQIGVVAARADGKPLFCQTTATTATVTDPSAAPGT
ncbi:MAG: hypothetical protein ABWY11_17020, partial [Umezawaea sp.]